RPGQDRRPRAVRRRFGGVPREQGRRAGGDPRASLDGVVARNANIRISAKVASNHDAILKKDAPAVADAVREVAALARDGH
ncbi:hypothetical protein ACRAWF_37535, partial [Streptomyces sp. L7]